MQAKSFKAVLEKGDKALGWTIARVPFAPAEAWPKMVRLRVKGEVEGAAFRTSLFPCAGFLPDAKPGEFYLLVNKEVQRAAGVGLGQAVQFRLEPDMEERPADLPDELAVLLDEEPGLRGFYDELSEYARREIGKWIGLVKSDASRMKRCEQIAERLLATMEAEVELPPVIATAFRRRPKAKAGWAKMTATQRRNELMGVFHYQSPEAREKRVGKLCDLAEKKQGAANSSK